MITEIQQCIMFQLIATGGALLSTDSMKKVFGIITKSSSTRMSCLSKSFYLGNKRKKKRKDCSEPSSSNFINIMSISELIYILGEYLI